MIPHTYDEETLPILYSRTSAGQVQTWRIEVFSTGYMTHEGILNGVITTSKPTICEGKNSGKKNETTAGQQAFKEAKALWTKKVASGYFERMQDIDNQTYFEPMLAKKYGEIFPNFPTISNPKLDGQRCIINKDGAWSRNGKPILSIPHIIAQLKPFLAADPTLIFDGELYTHKFKNDFNKIMSLVRKSKPSQNDLIESENFIEYWIYDFPNNKGFFDRYQDLVKLFGRNIPKSIKVVEAIVCNDQEALDNLYGHYLEEGYEGQIIRILDGKYENKRSKNLLKRKEFMDEEHEIISIEEGLGNRSGMAGYAHMKLPDGRIYKTNIKGNFDYLKDMLKNKEKYVGKMATIKFFNFTPDGIPRFPYLIAVRDYE